MNQACRKLCMLFLLALSACSGSEDSSKTATIEKTPAPGKITANPAYPSLLDKFEVGKDVYVRSLTIEEATNTLWIGTSVGVLAINLQTLEPVHSFTRDDGLSNEYVFAIGIDRQGYKWFGTNAGGVSRFREGKWEIYFPMHGLADYWIYSFAQQQNGDYWIGTWAGANKVNLDKMEFKTYVNELINEWVYAIDVDTKDRVWFGTEGGISMFDGVTWQEWNHDKNGVGATNKLALPGSRNTGLGTRTRHDLSVLVSGGESYNPNYVFSLLVAADDTVWAGTWGGGVSQFDGQTWNNLSMDDGLAGNIVYALAQDKDNTFWFGTNHGLSRYDGKTWHNYNTAEGLLDSNVYAIATGADGDVWVGTKHGVVHIGYANQQPGKQYP